MPIFLYTHFLYAHKHLHFYIHIYTQLCKCTYILYTETHIHTHSIAYTTCKKVSMNNVNETEHIMKLKSIFFCNNLLFNRTKGF